MKKPKLCYIIHTLKMRRSLDEIAFLHQHFDVESVELENKSLFSIVLQLLFVIPRCHLVYSWHCNKVSAWAVFLCNVLDKKSFVIVSGHEVADVHIYKYGAWGRWIDRVFVRYILNNAYKILPVSKFLYDEVLSKVKKGNNVFLLYAGINIDDFIEPEFSLKDDRLVITICPTTDSYIWRKGLECFVRLGYYLPEYRFLVVGKHIDDSAIRYLKSIAAHNVVFTGFVSDDRLNSILNRAKIFCLLSFYEAFGSVLVEAMSKGCIPIVTNDFNDFRNIVGNTGLFVDYNNIVDIVDKIKMVDGMGLDEMKKCRDRVIDLFSMDKRTIQLEKVLKCI